ncbi:MAG: FAD-binding oxidoreductase, partial [Rubrobacteridae bacterium]|nr:FAD-binding oxidoreductase [Rubrobacteridae bacterium]
MEKKDNTDKLDEEKDESGASRGWKHSLWIDTSPDTDYPLLSEDVEVDVAIIGAGIVGITTAFLLHESGKKVALIDMNKIAKEVTGHTTAKITALHGLKYDKLLSSLDLDRTRAYAEANMSAIEIISLLVSKYGIDCDFKEATAYIYTETGENLALIKKEMEAAKM